MSEIKKLMSKLKPCFGKNDCEHPLECPLEPQCANKWLKDYQKQKEKTAKEKGLIERFLVHMRIK